MKQVVVAGAFDDLRFKDMRFLNEASKLGRLRVALWTDELLALKGIVPKFPQAEREYLLRSLRYVDELTLTNSPRDFARREETLVRRDTDAISVEHRGPVQTVSQETLMAAVPTPPVPQNPKSDRPKVVVTGCFDWFHSGHVRFFEEIAELGDLYVVVGSDENLRLLKGPGHPLFPAAERRFQAGSVRFVTAALISSGAGWMDAEPEFLQICPDIYAVNEDGDKPEKRAFCERSGITYRVLARAPKAGLPKRQSTQLRGF